MLLEETNVTGELYVIVVFKSTLDRLYCKYNCKRKDKTTIGSLVTALV